MPATAVGALIALLIAPGFLLVRGYEGRRYRNRPDRDIYAVAEAVVASAVWLGVAWIILVKLPGNLITRYGLLPLRPHKIEHRPVQVVVLGLFVVVTPYAVGKVGALIANALDGPTGQPWITIYRSLQRLGFFSVPTAWDQGWGTNSRRNSRVVLQLTDGSYVVGGFGKRSRIDQSPLKSRDVYLAKVHAQAGPSFEGGVPMLVKLDDPTVAAQAQLDPAFTPVEQEIGILIDGGQIAAVFFGG